MKKLCSIFASVILLIAFPVISTSRAIGAPRIRESMIVSTEWLAKHLKDKSLVMLQVGEKDEYLAAHIPGAQFIAISDISTPRGKGLSLELPPVEQLKAAFEKLGVTDKSRIVVYFSKDWVSPTARVYFTLDYLGFGDRTSILDGGLPAWRAENRPVSTELIEPKAGQLTPRLNTKLVVDAAWVSANLNKPGVAILDARDAKYYSGADAGQMPRAGHIPGARSIPFTSVVEESNNKFKSVKAISELFNSAGVKPSDNIATYCHRGQQATLLYFAARYLGYDARLYDGSFEEWSRRADLPVVKSDDANTEGKP